jgi:hypothetical protein
VRTVRGGPGCRGDARVNLIFRHRDAGELRFTVSELEVSALPGTRLIVYTPQDGQTRDRLAAICVVPS